MQLKEKVKLGMTLRALVFSPSAGEAEAVDFCEFRMGRRHVSFSNPEIIYFQMITYAQRQY